MRNIPPSSQQSGTVFFSYEQWRERFLNVVLQASCVLGFVAIVLYLFTPSSALYKVLAVATYGVLVLVTAFSRLSYNIRAGVFLSLLFFAGLSSLFDYGMADASILFLGFIVMSGLLFSPRMGLYVIIAIMVLILVIFGWSGTSLLDSARLTAILLIVSTIIAIGLHTFQDDFTKTQRAARQTLDTLYEERSTLEERVEDRTAGLTRKTEQLRATSYIARKTAEVQDLATLLDTVAHLVTDQFGFYHTGIFLINESGNQVALQSASSEGGRRMVERPHRRGQGPAARAPRTCGAGGRRVFRLRPRHDGRGGRARARRARGPWSNPRRAFHAGRRDRRRQASAGSAVRRARRRQRRRTGRDGRPPAPLHHGDYVFMGQQLLRVEIV